MGQSSLITRAEINEMRLFMRKVKAELMTQTNWSFSHCAHYSSPSSIDRWLGFTRYTTRDATQFRDAIYLILSLSILSPPTQRHDLAPLTTTQTNIHGTRRLERAQLDRGRCDGVDCSGQ